MKFQKSFGCALILFIGQVINPAGVRAGAATDQVRLTADKVLAVLQDPGLKSGDKTKERREQLRQIIAARFDFSEMAKRSLGANWQRASADEQRRFVGLFSDLLETSYAGQIESYDGEKIVYGRESVAQGQAEVESKIITKKGQEIAVNYKLKGAAGEWKVYDVVIENVSIVNNFRTQFSRILAKSTFADLLKQLEAKAPENKATHS